MAALDHRREGFDRFNRGRAPDVQDNTHRTQVLVRQLNSKRMSEPVSNSVELKNAGLDERCRRSSIRKESGLLSECEPTR